MKILVDELPKDKYDCYFSEWVSCPPIVEKSGDYFYNLNNKKCNLIFDSTECEGLKVNE